MKLKNKLLLGSHSRSSRSHVVFCMEDMGD